MSHYVPKLQIDKGIGMCHLLRKLSHKDSTHYLTMNGVAGLRLSIPPFEVLILLAIEFERLNVSLGISEDFRKLLRLIMNSPSTADVINPKCFWLASKK